MGTSDIVYEASDATSWVILIGESSKEIGDESEPGAIFVVISAKEIFQLYSDAGPRSDIHDS